MVLRPLHGTSATLDDSAKDASENVYDALHTLVARGDASPAASVCVVRAFAAARVHMGHLRTVDVCVCELVTHITNLLIKLMNC
jgi:hypothetical protein